jgi:hypothetical protein
MINEAQRLHLVKILESIPLLNESRDGIDRIFVDCLKELPKIEKENPGTVHGLCL